MPKPRMTLRDLFCLVAIAAVALGWWLDRRHLAAELAALRRANELAKDQARFMFGEAVSGETQPASTLTPEQFVAALRDTKDWYQFADHTADPFVKTPAADQAIPALIALLTDPDKEVRTRAACTLGKINRQPNVIVPALVPALDDSDANVRWHAANALGTFGRNAQSAIPALHKQVDNDASPIAAFAAVMIQSIDPTANMEPSLVRLLGNALLENRRRAVAGLSRSRSESVKAALIDAFERETDSELKDQMATTIAAIDARLNPE